MSYYPHRDDPNFIQIISSKKEFKNSTIKYPISKNKDDILKNSQMTSEGELTPRFKYLTDYIL